MFEEDLEIPEVVKDAGDTIPVGLDWNPRLRKLTEIYGSAVTITSSAFVPENIPVGGSEKVDGSDAHQDGLTRFVVTGGIPDESDTYRNDVTFSIGGLGMSRRIRVRVKKM